MKRTRRVEVIRYSRRSTVISYEVGLEPGLAAEQSVIDGLLGIPSTVESPIETAIDTKPHQAEVSGPVRRGGLLGFFRRLIRG